MDADALKRKLRELKRLEERVVRGSPGRGRDLVWRRFFSTGSADDPHVRYPMRDLLGMDHQRRKEVFEEYLYWVYYQSLQLSGLRPSEVYDPELLSRLGLPAHATADEVKSRFRELIKKHHPDVGGDHDQMIDLLDTYNRIFPKGRG